MTDKPLRVWVLEIRGGEGDDVAMVVQAETSKRAIELAVMDCGYGWLDPKVYDATGREGVLVVETDGIDA